MHRASDLRKGVDDLLPRLTADAPRDRFDKLRAELEEVRAARDDADRLGKLGGGWRDPMARALAGLLRFYLDPGQPVVAPAHFPSGELSYAVLNAAPREAHIAVQQGDDPRRLLIGYLGWARKGLHFFADADRLVCTGRSPSPPASFLQHQVEELPYRLTARSGGFACAHLAAGAHRPALEVAWSDAATTVAVCQACARDDRHLLGAFSGGLAIPDPEGSFTVRVTLGVACDRGSSCPHAQLPELPRAARKGYTFGRLSDAAVVREFVTVARDRLERSGTPLFVAAGTCYGEDAAAFIAALTPTPEERQALTEILPEVRGYFEIDEATASRALEKLWPTHAEQIVRSIVPDPQKAERLVREAKANPGRVSDLLRRAGAKNREQAVLDALPRYRDLVPEAAIADAIARVYRTQGAGEAAKQLLHRLPREGKERGVGFGLLLALGHADAHRWQFTDTEQQFGSSLAPAAEALLAAAPGDYDAAFQGLLGRAGVAHWGRPDLDEA